MANYLLIKELENSLRSGNTEYATQLLTAPENETEVKNSSWDIIPVITQYISSESTRGNQELCKCCDKLLLLIAEKSNPEEVVLQLIDEIEDTKDDVKFKAILDPLQCVLGRISAKKIHSLAWCLNAVQTFVNKLEIPEYEKFTGREKLLIDTYDSYQKIIFIYEELLFPFYDRLISNLQEDSENVSEFKQVITKFLVQLLGKPLGFLDMEIISNIKGKARILAEKLVFKILIVHKDPFSFLEIKEANELITPNTLGVAVLFYLIMSQHVGIKQVPKVYDAEFIVQYSLRLLHAMFNEGNQMIVEKGLDLANAVFYYLKGRKLSHLALDLDDHREFCKSLAAVIIYSPVETYRKRSFDIFKIYLQSFDKHGSYLLIYNLMSIVEHSGLKSAIISFYKDLLVKEFAQATHEISEYFRGTRLLNLLKKFCYLPLNEATDLVDNSDQIIAALNLLRYLVIRDKNNITGICNNLETIEHIFLQPLRKGIEMSKAHYELKIKEVKEEQSSKKRKQSQLDVSVSVGGANLSEMPATEKLKVLNSSMTALDVIDSLLSRLNECIPEAQKSLESSAVML